MTNHLCEASLAQAERSEVRAQRKLPRSDAADKLQAVAVLCGCAALLVSIVLAFF